MTDFMAAEALTALRQVVLIDVVLAGENAIVRVRKCLPHKKLKSHE
jgi:predicted tellurium resistance membrane protein TerC